jgi:hypothetical protein
VGSLERIYDQFKDRAEFFMVYIREAHPTDGWQVPQNERQGVLVKDPKTLDERNKVAAQACSMLKIKLPCLVDGMDDAVNRSYGAWPDRIYVVDKDGKIAVMGAQGPAGFPPSVSAARSWLEQNLGAARGN